MEWKLLYYKTQIQILLRGYSTCFIMPEFKNNELNNDRNNVSSVLEKINI